jgi:hypothetical protein
LFSTGVGVAFWFSPFLAALDDKYVKLLLKVQPSPRLPPMKKVTGSNHLQVEKFKVL